MPYNNTPIAPPKEYTGSIFLPLARVKKIIQADEEIESCSNNAAFVITVATELFIQHMVEQTANIVRTDSRRVSRGRTTNVNYNDIANAVARVDNLEFLSDIVPKTITLKQYREKRARDAERPAGQRTIEQMNNPRREEADVEMVEPIDANGTTINGHHPPQSPDAKARVLPPASPAGGRGRASFDVVRNGFEDTPMDG